ncbi:LOW QUALITY PROTEIN: hypothetical protein ACHAWX_002429 [Stephanocyclus meneghinianus]
MPALFQWGIPSCQFDIGSLHFFLLQQTTHRRRWKAEVLTWMGGDMMRLSSDNLDHETGIEFDPAMIAEGEKAEGMAEKYFPGLVW